MKATESNSLPGVMVAIVGAEGVVRGVPEVLAVAVPSPIALTALICTL